MAWNNGNRGGRQNNRGRDWKPWKNGGRNNGQQDDDNQQNHQKHQKQQKQRNQKNQQNQQGQQDQQGQQGQQNGWQNQQNDSNQQNSNGQQNGNLANNGQDNSKDSKVKIDWNKNGWVGTKNNNTNNSGPNNNDGSGNSNDNNGNRCCFWQEVSQDPYLRQVYGYLSNFLANNKDTFCPGSPPSSSDVIMTDARQAKTAFQKKVDKIPDASMLLSTSTGRFIGQALHGYFEPCMSMDVLNQTYIITKQDVNAPRSQLVGKYAVHSRSPFLPNGPKDLFVQIKVIIVPKQPKRVEMVVSPCDTDGFNFEGPVGVMNKYRRDLTTPIDGYEVTGELDGSPDGMYLSLVMGQAERAWEYIYSSLLKCPQ